MRGWTSGLRARFNPYQVEYRLRMGYLCLHMFGQTQPLREAPEWAYEIRERFGVLPNFFRLTPEIPQISVNLWHFAEVAYLDIRCRPSSRRG